MFPPVKRVSFAEKLVEIAPTPIIEDLSDTEPDAPATEAEQRRRREVIEAEDGHATPMQGRRKRRREWVWRPMEDDVLASHNMDPVKDARPALDDAIPCAEPSENPKAPPYCAEETDTAAASASDAGTPSNSEQSPSSGATSLSQGSSELPES